MNKKKTIVVKVGTSTLTQGKANLDSTFMHELASQLAHLQTLGHHVILVSSGAIAAGKELLQAKNIDRSLPSKQMFAAIGQVHLMQIWSNLFSAFSISVGQILLTRDDLSNRKRYLNARNTLYCLLQHGVIPIINENDSVATKEIKVGDNDNLAALVANLIGADLLILLTDQQGLYTADPRINSQAELISTVKHIDASIFALAKGSSHAQGTGGMTTKLQAAQKASQCGTRTVIASSAIPHVLQQIIDGKLIGTSFLTHLTPQESRKRWLLSEKSQGQIVLDVGAEAKVMHHGASLLPSGIVSIIGTFDRGAIIQLVNSIHQPVAIGITNYTSHEINKLIGKQSGQIEEILGYTYGIEIVHRTNMTRIKTLQE